MTHLINYLKKNSSFLFRNMFIFWECYCYISLVKFLQKKKIDTWFHQKRAIFVSQMNAIYCRVKTQKYFIINVSFEWSRYKLLAHKLVRELFTAGTSVNRSFVLLIGTVFLCTMLVYLLHNSEFITIQIN